eukprot:gene2815-biopygen3576
MNSSGGRYGCVADKSPTHATPVSRGTARGLNLSSGRSHSPESLAVVLRWRQGEREPWRRQHAVQLSGKLQCTRPNACRAVAAASLPPPPIST